MVAVTLVVTGLVPGGAGAAVSVTTPGARSRPWSVRPCSTGKFQDRMTKAGLKNIEEMVLEYPKGFEELDKHLAKLPAASYDAVITIRNYHDLKNPKEVLAELKRILKPGGILGIADSRTARVSGCSSLPV